MKRCIRKMNIRDIAEICEIERASFPDPWSAQIFYQELTHNPLAYYWVLEDRANVRIIGYIGAWLVIDEGQITNFAIRASERGQGWGEKLLLYLMRELKRLGAEKMTLEVRVSNTRAQSLYRKLGFVSVGIRPRYYKVCPEDAMIMWVSLNEEANCARN